MRLAGTIVEIIGLADGRAILVVELTESRERVKVPIAALQPEHRVGEPVSLDLENGAYFLGEQQA